VDVPSAFDPALEERYHWVRDRMNYHGYGGNILYVNLTTGQIRTEPLDETLAKKYIGGCGIGLRLLHDLLKPGIAPHSPENPIIISAGPLVGTLVPASNKIQMLTKFAIPADKEQTKYYVGIASGGSHRFGLMMKNAGYDQIVVTGSAKKPVYLKIINGTIEICDAADLWGMDVYETTNELTERHNGSGVISIGRGGESMAPLSLAFVDARNTIGKGAASVMGSKNLKAIAVYGDQGVKVWDPKLLMKLATDVNEAVRQTPYFNKPGIANWSLGEKWAVYYPPKIWNETLLYSKGCSSCSLECKSFHKINTGLFSGDTLATGVFMLVPTYGRRLELKDYGESMELLAASNRLGIDFSQMAGMSKFLTRLKERGLLTTKDMDGLDLRLGDVQGYLKLAHKMANRDGIGDTMAQGWHPLSLRVGVDPNTDPDGDGMVKGTSALYDARFTPMDPTRFMCVVNPRGAMHSHPITYYPGRSVSVIREFCQGMGLSEEEIEPIFSANDFNCGRLERHCEDGEAIWFALGVCSKYVMYGIYNIGPLATFYTAVTGFQITPEDLKKAGERIWNLYKIINVREGFDRADDVFPGLWVKTIDEPIKSLRGEIRLRDYFGKPLQHKDLEKMLDDYYDERGWSSSEGTPTEWKKKALGLEDLDSKRI
jgi:aldehyde:ferredoxin oxidoreductase